MSTTMPLRLVPVFPSTPLGEDVLARGGRCFTVRHPGAACDGDILVAVPELVGSRQVLVPRGLGRPLVARNAANGWVVEGSGEVCGSRRWCAVGGLAARVRSFAFPRGPSTAVAPLRRAAVPGALWLAIRVENPALVALSRAQPSLRRGPVAVHTARIVEASPSARAAGVCPGMSLRLARRKCPDLRLVVPSPASVLDEVRALLDAEVGEVTVLRGGVAVRVGGANVADVMAHAERIALRLWQECGVNVRLAIAHEAGAALHITRLLHLDQVAYIPATGAAAWRRRGGRAQRGDWGGTRLVDVEGIVAMARALVDSGNTAGTLRVNSPGRHVTVACVRPALGGASEAESALRARALDLGEVESMSFTAAEATAAAHQLPLLARSR